MAPVSPQAYLLKQMTSFVSSFVQGECHHHPQREAFRIYKDPQRMDLKPSTMATPLKSATVSSFLTTPVLTRRTSLFFVPCNCEAWCQILPLFISNCCSHITNKIGSDGMITQWVGCLVCTGATWILFLAFHMFLPPPPPYFGFLGHTQ